jgi:isopenicillin N synthase-like dioxygenase
MSNSVVPPISLALSETDPEGFARALGGSFERYGFAVVSDHGLDEALVARALADTKAFFALPDDAKRAYTGRNGARGYTPFGVETAKGAAAHDLKEFWHVGRDLPAGHPYEKYMAPNVWPSEVPGFHDSLAALYAALDAVGLRLLSAIARHLGLAPDWFDDKVRLGNSILRLLHYPPVKPESAGHVRAGAHEDINVITLLLGAEEAGLELLAKDADGSSRWLPIAPPPGALVVNIGDMLQRLTNGVLPSTSHRVVNPAPERMGVSRYSTPFFLHFEPEFVIAPLPGCVGPGRPPEGEPPIMAEDFLKERLREIKLA